MTSIQESQTIEALQAGLANLNERIKTYEQLMQQASVPTFDNNFTSRLTPLLVFQPKTVQEISDFVRQVKQFLQSGLAQLAIRGSGHYAHPAASNVDKGILIDMSSLKGVVLENNNTRATLAAGESWAKVYEYLAQNKVFVAGPRFENTSVGGFIANGGFSIYPSPGLADSVVAIQIILADGSLVRATPTHKTRLFNAILDGCGNNLGIIVQVQMKTFKYSEAEQGNMGDVWGGNVAYYSDEFQGQLIALNNFATDPQNTESDAYPIVSMYWADTNSQVMCQNKLYCCRTKAEPEALRAFGSSGPKQVVKIHGAPEKFTSQVTKQIAARVQSDTEYERAYIFRDILDGNKVKRAWVHSNRRIDGVTTSFRPTADLMAYTTRLWLDMTRQWSPMAMSGLLAELSFEVIWMTLDERIVEDSEGEDSDEMNVDVTAVIVVRSVAQDWRNDKYNDAVIGAQRIFLARVEEMAASEGREVGYKHMAYAGAGQDVFGGRKAEDLKLLKDVARHYDPEGFFRKYVVGGCKLPY